MQLHAHPAHEGIERKAVELRAHVVGAEVGIGADRVRPAGRVRRALHPSRLVFVALGRPVCLHVDRFDDAGPGYIGAELLDRVIAPNRLIGAENAGLHRAGEPGKVALPPDMMMAVGHRIHDALLRPSANTWSTMAGTDPPSTISSTKGKIATSASVRGRKSRPTASGVSQLSRQAPRDSLATASASAVGSPRSRPSETTSETAPRA